MRGSLREQRTGGEILLRPPALSYTPVILGWTLGVPVSQRLLFTAPSVPKDESTAQRRMTDLIHKRCHRQKPMNTNSHYSKFNIPHCLILLKKYAII
jgi:hypothetical protein